MPTQRTAGSGQRVVSMPQPQYPDDETFFRRIRSLNTVVDKLPAKEELASVAVATPAPVATPAVVAKAAAVQPVPVVEEPVARANEEPAVTFRTDLSDSEDEEERKAKRKWIAIIAVCVGLVLLIAFRLLHSGSVSMVQHMVVPQPADGVSSVPSEANPATDPSEPKAASSKPSASTLAERTADERQQSDESQAAPAQVQSQMMHDQLLAPTRIPQGAKTIASNEAPPAAGFGGANMAALGGTAPATNVFGSAGSKAPAVTLKQVNVSAGVATGMLIHKTQPIYPSIAKAARVSGMVVIEATISKTGNVVNPHALSGPQMLRQAALDAVRTWRYRPYMLNNQPTEVQTTIDVIFALNN